jgi:hypothetical protein
MREYFSNRDSGRWNELREEFEQAQAGGCAICREPLTATRFLDHSHVTGFVRGVLCSSCNTKLGWYEKRRAAIEGYLARAAYYDAHSTAS